MKDLLLELLRRFALECDERHDYLPKTPEEASQFRPHLWVIHAAQEAQREAYAEGRDDQLEATGFRGYAHLGTGQYVINHSADAPAELIISIATEAEKAGRTVGDDRDNEPGKQLQPDVMAVRLRFENVSGLDALEKQLRYLREVHFAKAAGAAS